MGAPSTVLRDQRDHQISEYIRKYVKARCELSDAREALRMFANSEDESPRAVQFHRRHAATLAERFAKTLEELDR